MKYIHIGVVALLLAIPAVSSASSFNSNLFYGLTNSQDVVALQEFLTVQGDYTGPITGNFYALTMQGVKAFQTRNGIQPVSGYFGSLSRGVANQIFTPTAPIEETGNTTVEITPVPPVQTPILGSTPPVTPAPAPVVEAPVAPTPILTDLFEILKTDGRTYLRVESSKPIDFSEVMLSSGTITSVSGPVVSTAWFWTSNTHQEVLPSYYYEADIEGGENKITVTLKDSDNQTRTAVLTVK